MAMTLLRYSHTDTDPGWWAQAFSSVGNTSHQYPSKVGKAGKSKVVDAPSAEAKSLDPQPESRPLCMPLFIYSLSTDTGNNALRTTFASARYISAILECLTAEVLDLAAYHTTSLERMSSTRSSPASGGIPQFIHKTGPQLLARFRSGKSH
ncbi:hypothetical protein EDB85DRAFT_1903152 [Lactarius pseudohatsudake]|nr:hypothetical protein EDB85DRAFT_1903152 [Lactarius pseudohatsudake]